MKKLRIFLLSIYIFIIFLGINCLILNLDVVSVFLYRMLAACAALHCPQCPSRMEIVLKTLDISLFYIITIISCLELILNIFRKHPYFRNILIGVLSIINSIIVLLIFIYPKILVLDRKYKLFFEYTIKISYREINIGGIFAILLSSLLLINTIISILYNNRYYYLSENGMSKPNYYRPISRNLLVCPYCRSKIDLNDFYCSFCSAIVFKNLLKKVVI